MAKAQAGIKITLQTKTFNFLISNYNNANPAAAKYKNEWGVNNYGGLFMDYFPTQEGVWNTDGGFNTGGYSDPKANSLMTAVGVRQQRRAPSTNEADYFSKHLPVLFFPDQDYLLAVNSKKVGSTSTDGWTATTQQQLFPQFWFAKK